MSPLPTPLNRQDANCCQHIRMVQQHNGQMEMYAIWPGTTESAQLGRGVCDDLRQARIKTAIGNLARALSPACELGKRDGPGNLDSRLGGIAGF